MSDATKQSAEAVNALAPEERKITAGGKEYTIRRLETRQIWPTLRAGLPIIEGLVALVGPDALPSGAGTPARPASPPMPPSALSKLVGPELAQFLQIMAEHGERITEIVAIGLDETIAKVGKFEPQELYQALKELIAVNRDFFTTRVAPLIGLAPGQPVASALSGAIGEAVRTIGAGETPSSS